MFWYISDPWPGKIEFTLNEVGSPDILFRKIINGPEKEGVYRINLADYGIELKPGTEYEWFLAIVLDPYERSADFLASATIKHIEPSDSFSKHLKEMTEDERPQVYAQKGYWYDMMETLSQRIDRHQDDKQLRIYRGTLLKQVNLPLAAAYDLGT